MDVKNLKIFLCVCEETTIRKAAEKLYITPQGVSKIIKSLEDELDIPLFVRTKAGIRTSEYGKILKHYAEIITKNADYLNAEILNRKRLLVGEINIACAYGTLSALGVAFLNEYRRINPNINLQIDEFPDSIVEKNVLEYKYPIGITGGNIDKKQFHATLLQKHKYRLLVNETNPLSQYKEVTFDDLRHQNLILLNKDFKTHDYVIKKCRESGFDPNIFLGISEISMAYKYCHQNLGVAITVDYVDQDIGYLDVISIPFRDDKQGWDIYLITKNKNGLGDVLTDFYKFVADEFA